MEELLRLNAGMNTLTHKEFKKLITDKLEDKQYLIKVLFTYYKLQIMNNKSYQCIIPEIQEFNKEITKIITSRQSDKNDSIKNDEIECEPLLLSQLPTVMISSISSFLEFGDLLNFEKCNKSIFIGTRSPKSLQELPLFYTKKLVKYVKKNGNIYHWNRFNLIKKFTMNIDDHFEYQSFGSLKNLKCNNNLKDMPFWSNLEILSVKNIETARNEDGVDYNDYNDLKTLPLNKLHSLQIDGIYWIDDDVLMENENLASLQFLSNYYCDTIKKLPDGLRGLYLEYKMYEIDHIHLAKLVNNLESIHLNLYLNKLKVHDLQNMNNLKELCMYQPSEEDIEFINEQKLDNLKRINLIYFGSQIRNRNKLKKKSLKALLSTPSINYISIKSDKVISPIMSMMNNALKNISKKTMKIRIQCEELVNMKEIKLINVEILKLIEILKKQTNDFMIIGKFYMKENNEILKDLKKDHLFIQSKVENHHDNKGKIWKIWKFVINNIECKLCGYQEMWLMRCKECENLQYYQYQKKE